VKIETKTDGIKFTALKIDSTGNFSKDWIFAYKNIILFDGEFEFTSKTHIKNISNGPAQFKIAIDHFKEFGDVNIPKGEYFIEFLMRKETLSSQYAIRHNLILIGYSKSTYQIRGGRLFTNPMGLETANRDKYAKLLKIKTPTLLFSGRLTSPLTVEKGILSPDMMKAYNATKNSIDWSKEDSIIQGIKHILLDIPSEFGGKEEGVVIKYRDKIGKFQQSYQTDQEARAEIKSNFRDTPENENIYWNNVRLKAFELLNGIRITTLDKTLKDLALMVKTTKVSFTHKFKDKNSILEDIQFTAKNIILRKLKGNNGALFLGKFRVLTKAHYNIIKKGISTYDSMNVVLVTSKDTANTRDLRMKMLKAAFGDSINIAESSSGNLLTLMGKFQNNINVILAGSDRVAGYRQQLLKSPDVNVVETPRTSDDISATKVIENINDEDFFKKNTPKEIHSMYKEILKTYEEVKE
jgi:nicotinamide mononucleotide adenylyltransferase